MKIWRCWLLCMACLLAGLWAMPASAAVPHAMASPSHHASHAQADAAAPFPACHHAAQHAPAGVPCQHQPDGGHACCLLALPGVLPALPPLLAQPHHYVCAISNALPVAPPARIYRPPPPLPAAT